MNKKFKKALLATGLLIFGASRSRAGGVIEADPVYFTAEQYLNSFKESFIKSHNIENGTEVTNIDSAERSLVERLKLLNPVQRNLDFHRLNGKPWMINFSLPIPVSASTVDEQFSSLEEIAQNISRIIEKAELDVQEELFRAPTLDEKIGSLRRFSVSGNHEGTILTLREISPPMPAKKPLPLLEWFRSSPTQSIAALESNLVFARMKDLSWKATHSAQKIMAIRTSVGDNLSWEPIVIGLQELIHNGPTRTGEIRLWTGGPVQAVLKSAFAPMIGQASRIAALILRHCRI